MLLHAEDPKEREKYVAECIKKRNLRSPEEVEAVVAQRIREQNRTPDEVEAAVVQQIKEHVEAMDVAQIKEHNLRRLYEVNAVVDKRIKDENSRDPEQVEELVSRRCLKRVKRVNLRNDREVQGLIARRIAQGEPCCTRVWKSRGSWQSVLMW